MSSSETVKAKETVAVEEEAATNWYFDKEEILYTPSIRKGLTYVEEWQFREEGVKFLRLLQHELGLDGFHETLATSALYFHRFYMKYTFQEFPCYVAAAACMLLAGKVEETPKRIRHIIRCSLKLLGGYFVVFFGDDPKKELVAMEKILLKTIKFDLDVRHPYRYLTEYIQCLPGDHDVLQNILQMAWTFINDSMTITLCVQWEPEVVAIALLRLSGKINQFEIKNWIGRKSHHLHWWDMYVEDLTEDMLDEIGHEILNMYETDETPSELPTKTAIELAPFKPYPTSANVNNNDSNFSIAQSENPQANLGTSSDQQVAASTFMLNSYPPPAIMPMAANNNFQPTQNFNMQNMDPNWPGFYYWNSHYLPQ